MAHAYNTLAARRQAALAARWPLDSGGPVGIIDVTDGGDCDCYQGGDPVPDQTGASGVNKVVDKAGGRPRRRGDRQDDPLDRGHAPEPGERAQTGDPTWGKTGTTDDNGDAWFCGATPKITACDLGRLPRTPVTPMETEFGGAPVDGGTFPALIFSQIVRRLRRDSGRRTGRRAARRVDDVDRRTTSAPPGAEHHRARAGGARAASLRRRRRRHRDAEHPAAPAQPRPADAGGGGPRRRAAAVSAAVRQAAAAGDAATAARESGCRRRRSATAARSPS